MRISDRLLKANGTNPDSWVDMFRREHMSLEVDCDELLVWFSTMIFAGTNSDKPISNTVMPYKLITHQKNAKEILTHINNNFLQIMR